MGIKYKNGWINYEFINISKRTVALYFSAFPDEAESYYNEVIAYEAEEEKRQKELEVKLIKYIRQLKKEELQQFVLQILFDGPERQYERFCMSILNSLYS